MAPEAERAEILGNLRFLMEAASKGNAGQEKAKAVLPLGIAEIDQALLGGMLRGALHEIAPSQRTDMGAALGFVFALISRAQKNSDPVLWIQQDFAAREEGGLYAPGLALYGLDIAQILLLRVAKPIDALWAMEEALASRTLSCVVAEIRDDSKADFTETRRLQLAARRSETLALLLRPSSGKDASAATTRWDISSLPGEPDEWSGIGKPRFGLHLTRNRQGPCGHWTIEWDRHERRFLPETIREPLSVAVVSASADRADSAAARQIL